MIEKRDVYYIYFDNQQNSDWPDLMVLENPLNIPQDVAQRMVSGREGWVWVHRLGYNCTKCTHFVDDWTAFNLNRVTRIDQVEKDVEVKE